ncbi:MAG: Rpn family recombination-promoting nuclease/putative transposase [Candidatus Dependentiae bacterium]|nr:Rpn family recombination-promoting nuclease/putative transposase [Candidatus Dependentiae bacterium]
MNFLNPQTDVAFKKLFGDDAHKNLVINFLNSLLERVEGEKIVDAVVNHENPVVGILPNEPVILDICCTDQKNNKCFFEIQVMAPEDCFVRATCYASLALGRQKPYGELIPVIFVGILNFDISTDTDYISHHTLCDKETGQPTELSIMHYYFIELNKFNKDLETIDTDLDKWIYLFKHAASLHSVPSAFKEPVFAQAFDRLSH